MKAKVNKRLKPFVDAGSIYKLMPVQTGYGAVGLDYHLCVLGRAVFIETKSEKSGPHLTPLQQETKLTIEKAGGVVYVVWDDTSLDNAMNGIMTILANEALRVKCAA